MRLAYYFNLLIVKFGGERGARTPRSFRILFSRQTRYQLRSSSPYFGGERGISTPKPFRASDFESDGLAISLFLHNFKLLPRIELGTFSLPMKYSTSELKQHYISNFPQASEAGSDTETVAFK